MVPVFPLFKRLELADRQLIEQFTGNFPPYNDFEFIDLWIYNPANSTTFTFLNDNLVVRRQDYITLEPVYSFLGTSNTTETIATLLAECRKAGIPPCLKHVPEVSISAVRNIAKHFFVSEDSDNFDYILSVDEIAELSGGKYYDKRNLVNRFRKHHPKYSIKVMRSFGDEIREEVKDLFYRWEIQKMKSRSETEIELDAIDRLFDIAKLCGISGMGVYNENILIGFATFHELPNHFAGMSLEKGDASFKGVYSLLNHEIAKILKSDGVKYLNYEQDLGVPGLKNAKKLWRPIFYLKKFSISEKIT